MKNEVWYWCERQVEVEISPVPEEVCEQGVEHVTRAECSVSVDPREGSLVSRDLNN